ncbi:hypothetical protein Pelo_17138 [Pelomyxa schiedti]|nr:hypothetical protein Pelo_17138 [Pelomyxa schiedti]
MKHSLTVPLEVIGECNVSEKGIKAELLTQPLVDRSSGMYYFPLGSRACELKVLVLNTGEVVTLSEGSQSARKLVVEAVDETHLSLTKGGHNTVTQASAKTSVYSLSELISSATALPPPPHSESSCFDQVTPIHVHHFSPGSLVSAVGCGIVTSSYLSMSSWHHSSEPKRPRLSNTRDRTISKKFYIPQFLMSHEFIDATTGTVLFKVKQTDVQVALLLVDIHPVPFHNPFPLDERMESTQELSASSSVLSWTLGIVSKPVYVTMDDRCVGWLGGMNFLTFDSDGLSSWKALHTEGTAECISSWKMQVRKVCCNQRWVVVAGSYCEMSGLFVSTVENCQPNCRQGSFLRYPWIDGVLSLRFLCFSEYECESSVVEAIYAEKRGSSEFVCVEHINLSTETSVSSQLVCECELPERPFGVISTPLVNRADGTC